MCRKGVEKVMLLEFSCSNYRSIKDRILFSTLASKDDTNEKDLILFDNKRVLRSAVIYGPNGSGKTNLIRAILFMKLLVINSINHQPGEGIAQMPHKLMSIADNSSFSIQFVKNNIRYAYGFSLKNSLVDDEYLYFYPNSRQVKIFERNSVSYSAGDKFKGKFDNCIDAFKPNRLFLSVAANFSSVNEIEKVFSFFRDDLIIYLGNGIDEWRNKSLVSMQQNQELKKTVVLFLRNLQTGIKDINITISDAQLNPSVLPPFLSEEFRNQIVNQLNKKIDTQIVYDTFAVDINEESSGVQKLIDFLCPFIDVIQNGKILICDELETNLHESLLHGLLQMFYYLWPTEQSQIVFTTHDTSLLDLDLFRRDQIWFTELKSESRSTDLYSLSEIKNVRKDENINKGYIAGKYGAIPLLNRDLASMINKL